ncbi:MAG: nrdR [Candidatus Saccharibacteria bacterium]|nr:nrdR [Candidatus Saccharibacteria bacterium]
MVCYTCGGDTAVLNSRPQKRSNQVWRRRQCVLCDTVYTTTESIDYAKSLLVQTTTKKRLLPFSRDRLLLSLYKSLGHRPTALSDAGGLCATIIAKLAPTAENNVINTRRIAETALVALNRFDKLAAQHYQAFHKL